MKNKIAWESWNQIYDNYLNGDIEEKVSEGEESDEEDRFLEALINAEEPLITPLGVLNPNNLWKPTTRFDLWIGYTNFPVTRGMIAILENIPGVELLKILGRYSFILGVGKMFDFRPIRNEIAAIFCTNHTLERLRTKLVKHKFWSIFVYPTGHLKYIYANDEYKFLKKNDHLKKLQEKIIGSVILNS